MKFETASPATFVGYRCEATSANAEALLQAYERRRFTGGPLKQPGLYVALDWRDWAAGSTVVLRLAVAIKNPVVTPIPLEIYNKRIAKRGGFDSIVSLPDTGFDAPQILLFHPERQVRDIKMHRSKAPYGH